MSIEALPCIICGVTLVNVWEEAENQPSNGVSCQTSGNYGSNIYDSFNGNYLEFNICDPCLIIAGNRSYINVGRNRRPVTVDGLGAGWEKVEYTPVRWDSEMPDDYGENEVLRLSIEEVQSGLPNSVTLSDTVENIVSGARLMREWLEGPE